ncbi:MAG: type II toxin-antitoxin system HicB family antitoxin [Deltaproteobacteria bacterium]|jgi:predicted RNase H-like HicB family nuclease|nr:type II toxin-antitoxin system HicB family antitoxin [Deltaproteobacteria bacterium]
MGYYFAVFLPVQEGGYAIAFPDIPEAVSQGEDLADCMVMAADVLAICADEYTKARKPLPVPSSLEQVEAWALGQKDDEGLNPQGKILFQLFRMPQVDATPVKISISVPKSTLAIIDERARAAGMTRSGFMAAAASGYDGRPHV